jgi:hypothetical protein
MCTSSQRLSLATQIASSQRTSKTFLADVLAVHGLTAIHPDDFIVAQLELEPITVLSAFKEMRARSKRPPYSVDEFVHAFERNGLVVTAQRLHEASELL